MLSPRIEYEPEYRLHPAKPAATASAPVSMRSVTGRPPEPVGLVLPLRLMSTQSVFVRIVPGSGGEIFDAGGTSDTEGVADAGSSAGRGDGLHACAMIHVIAIKARCFVIVSLPVGGVSGGI